MKENVIRLLVLLLIGRLFAEGFQLVRAQKIEANQPNDQEFLEVKKAAEMGDPNAQYNLGCYYASGRGVAQDYAEAVIWFRRAADQGDAEAQCNLGVRYANGQGVTKDDVEATKWYRKAAEKGLAVAQCNLGVRYANGQGVTKNDVEAAMWYRKAAGQGDAIAQTNLGWCYANGLGAPKDYIEAYKWSLLAGGQGQEKAKKLIGLLEYRMTAAQRAEGQRAAREFRSKSPPSVGGGTPKASSPEDSLRGSGTGFFITGDGALITNQHVVARGSKFKVLTSAGVFPAKIVRVDAANDLALLKAEGSFSALPVISSKHVQLGAMAFTVGFPNIGLQGFAPKLAKGEIASLAGAHDDARHFQISTPIQPGNSGGALVDERGNVIGVVVAKLSQKAALATSGSLAENVNYAVKGSYLTSFLESVPEVAAILKEPNDQIREFEGVVKSVEKAAVMVLVY